ncbi:hypothetical protein P5757_26535 [Bacillus tropicus]|uniref:hypothetical protein n=1 Tax=Bacillus tropicus TaxID=2026188 RepID=UPI000B4B2CB3|nr:hypothetical protein [Bacillus tropicus]MDF9558753.1 hypothetical protein [Bacillus tropicus]MDF9592291.1 hypothetical protein [Bacillus tropicus]MDF9650228.1 hypothetical protein [Bacillus tropicus]
MEIDWKLTAPAIVALVTFMLLHLFIEPRKEKKKKRKDKFKELYAPLYMMINARLYECVMHGRQLGRINQMYFGSAGTNQGFIDDDYMIEFILKNSSHASVDLLNRLEQYISNASEGAEDAEELKKLVVTVVKEYQQLRKELKIDYNKEELKTGIPDKVTRVGEYKASKLQKKQVAES